ncbi:unnamed protein product [Didymodactylos carnosus]|nr:unnamed protein product [Didymodactylos carnosus]CAF4461659.1 unnamed protein product [Didymodactylos carnosus]
MLSQAATGTTKNQLQQSVSTSLPTPKMVHGTLVMQQGIQNLDAAYRMALQNQTAYSTVDPKIIAERKLMDKDFAGQYRALVGYRSACISKSALKSAKSTS